MMALSTRSARVARLAGTAFAALAVIAGPSLLAPEVAPAPLADPCVNGVIPWNPYVVNCNLQPRAPRVRGSAPDAGAIIACRDRPGCLSWYVNGW